MKNEDTIEDPVAEGWKRFEALFGNEMDEWEDNPHVKNDWFKKEEEFNGVGIS